MNAHKRKNKNNAGTSTIDNSSSGTSTIDNSSSGTNVAKKSTFAIDDRIDVEINNVKFIARIVQCNDDDIIVAIIDETYKGDDRVITTSYDAITKRSRGRTSSFQNIDDDERATRVDALLHTLRHDESITLSQKKSIRSRLRKFNHYISRDPERR